MDLISTSMIRLSILTVFRRPRTKEDEPRVLSSPGALEKRDDWVAGPERRITMSLHSRWHNAVLVAFFVLAASLAWKDVVAQDLVHDISGVVKKVDKGTKTVVIKTSDGTEHTIKYTDKTVVEGTKDAGKGVAKGSAETYFGAKKGAKVTVHYTEEGGEKTATGVKDAFD
jgi:hypothetical protein